MDGVWWATVHGIAESGHGFPDSSFGKESTCNAGDPDLISGPGRSAGEGTGYPLQYAWASLVAQLAKSQIRLSDFYLLFSYVKGLPWGLQR